MNKEEITELTKKFSEDYGEEMLLKANIAAINKMIIKNGKEIELYNKIAEVMQDFRDKHNK